jgi:hypothetical protein
VHLDDIANGIYYTIVLDKGNEVQTIATHLTPADVGPAADEVIDVDTEPVLVRSAVITRGTLI